VATVGIYKSSLQAKSKSQQSFALEICSRAFSFSFLSNQELSMKLILHARGTVIDAGFVRRAGSA